MAVNSNYRMPAGFGVACLSLALLTHVARSALPPTAAKPIPVATVAPAEFLPALPGYRFSFPRDHSSHAAFKSEWWYYTGHLEVPGGRRFGYQLTFFRTGVTRKPGGPSRWHVRDLNMAHFAVADEANRRLWYHERLQRPGLGLADARTDRYLVFNGTWEARLAGGVHHLKARSGELAIDLQLRPLKPPVVHGSDGISRKGDCSGCASHYYSLTRLYTAGVLQAGNESWPTRGISWMDHEFGSNQLSEEQVGWDWYSLQMDDGTELMLYHLRRRDGRPVAESSGTYVRADGSWNHLPLQAFAIEPVSRWHSPQTGARYPMSWWVRVPGERLDLTVTPAFEDQELVTTQSTGVTYWEGSVHISGTRAGKPVKGLGYVEMTGYDSRFRPRI